MSLTRFVLILLILGVGIHSGQAQTTLPASPKKFVTRKNGSSTGAGSSIGLIPATKKPKTTTITITYTVLTKEREWENIDGKIMKARLLAFPSLIETTSKKDSHFTVVRDQKVRFLMSHNKRPAIYPLDKLSDFDREYIEEIVQAAVKAAKTPSSQQKNSDKEAGTPIKKPSIQKK